MWVILAALPVGAVIGVVAGGQISSVIEQRVHWWALLIVAAQLGLVIGFISDPPLSDWVLPAELVVLAVFGLRNLHLTGLAIVVVGVACNLVPILLNGSMTVRADSLVEVDLATPGQEHLVDLGVGRRLEEPGDLATSFGAIVPLRGLREVATFGDLIIAAGLLNVGLRLFRPLGATPRRGRYARHFPDELNREVLPVDGAAP